MFFFCCCCYKQCENSLWFYVSDIVKDCFYDEKTLSNEEEEAVYLRSLQSAVLNDFGEDLDLDLDLDQFKGYDLDDQQ